MSEMKVLPTRYPEELIETAKEAADFAGEDLSEFIRTAVAERIKRLERKKSQVSKAKQK